MGYNTLVGTNGNQGVGASFMNINNNGTMADITVSGYSGSYSAAGIYCSLLDKYGVSIKRMYWFDHAASTKPARPARYGWYSKDGATCYNEDSIAPGQGLWTTLDGDYAIKNAGEVISGTYAVALTNGNQFVANPTPVAVKMGDVHITDYTGSYSAAGIYCSLLDKYGVSIKRMYWFDHAASTKPARPARYGWYSKDGATCYNESDVVKPGEALWTTSDQDGIQMVWPSAIPTEE